MKNLICLILLFSTNLVAQVPNYVPLDGLAGWWPFNGNANDEYVFANHGIINGPILTTDRFSNTNAAYDFDGVNDYIEVLDAASLRVGHISMSVWVKSKTTSIRQIIYKGNRLNATNEAYSINSTLHTAIKKNSSCIAGQGWASCNFSQSLTTNVWKHIVVTYDGNSIKDYVDGVLVNSCSTSGLIDQCVGGNLRFGFNHLNLGNTGHPFYGALDDIGIWNRALTECEIQQLFHAEKDLINTDVTQSGNQYSADFTNADGYQWLDCSNNYQPILNQTNYIFNPSTSGNYAVEITDMYCKDTSACYTNTNCDSSNTFVKTYGGGGDDLFSAPIKANEDGYYMIPGITSSSGAGGKDLTLSKSDEYGNILWTKTYGGINDETGTGVISTFDNGYLITGYTKSFGSGNYDGYVIKTDGSGVVEWSKAYGGSSYDGGVYAYQTPDSGYMVGGRTDSYGGSSRDGYLVKFDKNGNQIWSKVYDTALSTHTEIDQMTSDGNYILNGYSSSKAFLMKIDGTGNIIWKKTYGAGQIFDVIEDDDGNLVSVGYNINQVIYLKTDQNGNIIWKKNWSNISGVDIAYSLSKYEDGFLISGAIESYGNGDQDVFFAKIDQNGNVIWAKALGNTGKDNGVGFVLNENNQIIATGSTLDTDWDMYLAHFDCNASLSCNLVDFEPVVNTESISASIPSISVLNIGVSSFVNTIESNYSLPDFVVCSPPTIDTCTVSSNFSISDSSICKNDTLFFTNLSSSDAASFQWLINGIEFSTDTNYIYVFDSAGFYSVVLEAKNGSCLSKDTINISVFSTPHTELYNDTICIGDTFVINLTPIVDYIYEWNPSYGVEDSSLLNSNFIIDSDTSLSYNLITTDGITGCFGKDSFNLIVDNCIKDTCYYNSDYYSDFKVCKGAKFILPAFSGGVLAKDYYYYYDFEGNLIDYEFDSQQIGYKFNTNLPVGTKLNVIKKIINYFLWEIDPVCYRIGIDTFSIEIIPNAYAQIEFSQISDVNYNFNGCCGTTYLWSDGSLFNDSTLQNPTAEIYVSDWIYLEVIDTNNCTSTDSLWINIDLRIPNIITPNSDNMNDYFVVKGLKVDNLQIYNRWGKLIYETKNYKNDWDGNDVPDGVYYYDIISEFENYKGWLQIIR